VGLLALLARAVDEATNQATGLTNLMFELPLRDSAGISPDFAGDIAPRLLPWWRQTSPSRRRKDAPCLLLGRHRQAQN
jgi:hypothetical protein